MNLDRYLRDYARTVASLAGVLSDWAALSSGLREHYSDELLLMLSRRPEVVDLARAENREIQVAMRLSYLDGEVMAYRRTLLAAMGFDPADMVLNAASMRGGGAQDTAETAYPVLALAA
jgi:hypothetical protein